MGCGKVCKNCSSNPDSRVVSIHIPFAAKLLFQELAAMNISARIEV